MKNFFPKQISRILGGKLVVRGNSQPVQIFTAQPEDEPIPGCLFFLFDGYEKEGEMLSYLKKNNVAGIVVREGHGLKLKRWKNQGINVIEVPHMTEPYIRLSKEYREQFDIPFIEVIGSSGKTTTKEMIGAVLNEKIPTLVGCKNYNAPSGVAYNIFRLRDSHKAAVLEVGMKGPGITQYSSDIIKPDIAVITSIHRAHYTTLGSVKNIIRAKAEVLKCLSKDSTLIINGEDQNCGRFPLDGYGGKVLKFGFSDKFDIYAADIKYMNFRMYFTAISGGFRQRCVIDTVGRYNVSNALAAFLVGLKLGMSPGDISKGLARFKTLNGRLKFHKGIYNTILIDDNFNANPDSTKLLIQEIPRFAKGCSVVLIIGDMERPDDDIEEYARDVHFLVGEEISKIKLEYLVAVGKWAGRYIDGAVKGGFPKENTAYFSTVEEAREQILNYIIPGSIILFKASVYTEVSELMEPLRIEK